MHTILITGVAGFIGSHLARALSERGHPVTGIDDLNDYYDVRLKVARLEQLKTLSGFTFIQAGIDDRCMMEQIFKTRAFDIVINLAAQVGVRYSLKNPHSYINSNIVGFTNILEECRRNNIKHLLFASSSSIYGINAKLPFSVNHNVDHPGSLYAASKRANELMAHTYAHLYHLPCTGLRFFTVYGPWGRPDMAYFSFTKSILEGKPIDVFNFGRMQRDFTYIDDVVESIVRLMNRIPQTNPSWDRTNPDPGSSYAPYKLYNIGSSNPVEMTRFIEILEVALNRSAEKKMLPMQPGDVPVTYADTEDLVKDIGFKPATSLDEGLKKFITWYRSYYHT